MPIQTTWKDAGSVPVKVWTTDIEQSARDQLRRLATLPIIHGHVAVMPDVHWGKGSTVGSVIPTVAAIIPAAVGVDIGCGMVAHRLDLRADDLPDDLSRIRSAIEAAVPHGRTDNGGPNDRGAWRHAPDAVQRAWKRLAEDPRLAAVIDDQPGVMKGHVNAGRHLGTLGTGNHFVELCLDTADDVWLMLHSGSRGIGNRIGTWFIEQAKRCMEQRGVKLADADLAWLPQDAPIFEVYWKALSWAQDYAATNRTLMMSAAKAALAASLKRPVATAGHAVNCHHNYVAIEQHYGRDVFITRKGAVRARAGDMGIIPGSMGARSYIVRGRGNPESFDSCAHGAGRRMSRGAAKKQYTVADLEVQTAGVECRKDADVIDEIPAAYKPIDEVMRNQADLVEVVTELRQVLCVKG
jgi:tRNA-splicing ligase RtcB